VSVSDRWGKITLRGTGLGAFLVMTVVLAWRLSDFGSLSKGAQYGWGVIYALYFFVVLMFLLMAIPARRMRLATQALRAARPGAVVVETSWSVYFTEFFLKRGPLSRKARGRYGYLLLVADERGIELIRPRGLFSFGIVPWPLVKSIRLDLLTAPLASRPKLVIEIHGDSTPYNNVFDLVTEGKEARANASATLAALLAKRPVGRR
jgi:hypothetical protein